MDKEKSTNFEVKRFFLALKRALETPELLQYMREKILKRTEENYLSLSDEEVKNYFRK